MASDQLRVSSEFPEGYGRDFALQSIDDVICYFPGPILGHMSSVFKDMFTLGGSDHNKGPIKIAEPITTVELFLTHLDPNNLPPPIDRTTIGGLIQMADKYNVTKIIRWYEQEATVQRVSKVDSDVQEAFITTDPVVVLSLASRFNLSHTGRLAMRELIGCNWSILFDGKSFIDPVIQKELFRLRNQRLNQYQNWIHQLTADIGGIPSKVCDRCLESKGRWILKLMSDVQAAPVWSSFIAAFNHAATFPCKHCETRTWDRIYFNYTLTWMKEAKTYESRLPEWPM